MTTSKTLTLTTDAMGTFDLRLYTSDSTNDPGILLRDAARIIDVTGDTLAKNYSNETGVGLTLSRELVRSGKRSLRTRVLTLSDARQLLNYYANASRVHRRREALNFLSAYVGAMTAAFEPELDVETIDIEDPVNSAFEYLNDIGAALQTEVKQAVGVALQGVKVVLNEEDLAPIRKMVREEVRAALRDHIDARGGVALSIIDDMNGGSKQLTLPAVEGPLQ